MDSPGIAVIGTGYWGQNHVRAFSQLGALRAVCDSNTAVLDEMAKSYPGIRTVSDYHQILDDNDITGVVIALPAQDHYKCARACLEHGKDVLVEKPLTLELKDAYSLKELAEVKKSILMVGHLLRYHSAYVKLRELAMSGSLGRIQYIYSNRLSFGKIRREENALWSFAPHDISMILALTGEYPSEIKAVGANYLHANLADVTTTHMRFPSGINSHIFVSWLHPFKEQKLVIVAEHAMAVFEDTADWDKKITLYLHQIAWKSGMPIPEKGKPEMIPVAPSEPLIEECKHFLECITNRKQPLTDANEGIQVLRVLDTAQNTLTASDSVHKDRRGHTETYNVKTAYYNHPTAVIDENCEIGSGTKIWHFSHVMSKAKIGRDCILGQNVNISDYVTIGNNVKIQNNVSIYTGTIIEDDVFLGPSCVLTNVKNPRSQINRHSLYSKTHIRRGATVGANATIVCGITIGKYAFIAAGAVVTKDVADYALMVGVPARQEGWMSRHGIKLEQDKSGFYICKESGLRYKEDQGLLQCIDIHEDEELALDLRVGKISYDDIKRASNLKE